MLQKSSPAPFFLAFAEFCFLRHLFRLAASLACLKSDYYAVVSSGGGGRYQLGPSPSHFFTCRKYGSVGVLSCS